MKTPHKHADLIKAYADGAEIQIHDGEGVWTDVPMPVFNPMFKYRIKPEPKVYSYPVLKMPLSGRVIIGVSSLQTLETKTSYKLEFDVLNDVPSNPRFVKV